MAVKRGREVYRGRRKRLNVMGVVFGAIALARYSYRPIKALLDTIERQGESEAHFPNGDWEPAFIGNQLSRMYSEARLLHETLARQQPVVRGHLLQQVLRGAPVRSCSRHAISASMRGLPA